MHPLFVTLFNLGTNSTHAPIRYGKEAYVFRFSYQDFIIMKYIFFMKFAIRLDGCDIPRDNLFSSKFLILIFEIILE